MKLQHLQEASYAGPKTFHNLLQYFTEDRRRDRGHYVPRNEVSIKNVVDKFEHEGEEDVRRLTVFYDKDKVRIFYRDMDQTVSFDEAVEKLGVFSLKRIF